MAAPRDDLMSAARALAARRVPDRRNVGGLDRDAARQLIDKIDADVKELCRLAGKEYARAFAEEAAARLYPRVGDRMRRLMVKLWMWGQPSAEMPSLLPRIFPAVMPGIRYDIITRWDRPQPGWEMLSHGPTFKVVAENTDTLIRLVSKEVIQTDSSQK